MTKEEFEKKIKQLQDDIDCLTLACENYREEMEKNLADATDLEKENAELKTVKIPQLERKIASIRGAHSVDCRKLNARTEQVERLKKENAELKEQVKEWKALQELYDGKAFKRQGKYGDVNKQLTKAKEIIKSFSEFVNNEVEYDPEHTQEHTDLWNELCEQAGQFLKEVSE